MVDSPENPFTRRDIIAQEIARPAALSQELIDAHHCTQITDGDGQGYNVMLFKEWSDLPGEISEWLHYQAYTDPGIATQTADDRTRFGDPKVTSERFLHDHGGRRLYVVTPLDGEATLAGAVWLHALQGDINDADLVAASQQVDVAKLKGQSHIAKHLGDISKVDSSKLATLAIRVYGDHRGKHLSPRLLGAALRDYYQTWQECQGVVVRISTNDANAVGLFEGSHSTSGLTPFINIASGNGGSKMLHLRPPSL